MNDPTDLKHEDVFELFDTLFDEPLHFEPHLSHIYQIEIQEVLGFYEFALDGVQFVEAWKEWRAKNHESMTHNLSVTHVMRAFSFATAAASLGLLYATGRGVHFRLWRAPASEAPVYERISNSRGRLAVPPSVKGLRRTSVKKRHDAIAGSIIEDLLDKLTVDPEPAWAFQNWFDDGLIPAWLKGATYSQARHALSSIHKNISMDDQIFWMCVLRLRLLELGLLAQGEMPTAPTDEDIEALVALANFD